MRVGLHHEPLPFNAHRIAAELSPGDEKLLLGSEAVDVGGARLAFQGFLVGEIRDLCAAQVADAFTEHQLAVVVYAIFDKVVIELIGDAGSARLKIFQVLVRPPVAKASEEIVLRPLIVEAMRDSWPITTPIAP